MLAHQGNTVRDEVAVLVAAIDRFGHGQHDRQLLAIEREEVDRVVVTDSEHSLCLTTHHLHTTTSMDRIFRVSIFRARRTARRANTTRRGRSAAREC